MPPRYLSLAEVLELHRLVVAQAGGATGLRDLGALESAAIVTVSFAVRPALSVAVIVRAPGAVAPAVHA